ncbi:hypothetical protein CE91St42_14590 [Oscillospiraceae bacterium]|nr:hypothetical protein CE91St42_14590 [Oscillospiraceae bacterium]
MSKKISTLAAGNLVKLNENGTAKKFIFLQHNHYGQGEVTLLRKDTAGFRAFAPGSSSYNVYNGADLDDFCNVVFPGRLDPVIRACLVDVPLPTIRGHVQGTWDATVQTLRRRGFSLSMTELGLSGSGTEGTKFNYFGSNANRIAYHDETSTAVRWWSRSSGSGSGDGAWSVVASGDADSRSACFASRCARPALALSSEILVSDSPDSSGCYTIEDAVIAGEQYQKVNGVWRRMC